MTPVPARATIATALLLTAGCDGRGAGEAPGDVPGIPTFEGAIDLEIGEITGDDPYLFTSVGSIVEDMWGRIVVADMQSSEIRVFEPNGSLAFLFGGPGEGPGELSRPCCLEFAPGGELWVRESARYSVFRLDSAGAEFQRVLRSPHPGQIGLIAPFVFDADGQFVSVGPVRTDDDPSATARLRVDADGVVDTVFLADGERQTVGQTTVSRTVGNSRFTIYLHQPLGPTWIHAHANGGAWAEAVTSEYSINLHQPNGSIALIEGPALEGPMLTPAEREWARERMDREIERAELAEHPFGIPERKPPLAAMFFDRRGRLWIEKTAAAGATMREADVYDGTTLTARYRWPLRIRDYPAPWATESALYGVTVDSLGVQRVARVRFGPGS